MTLSKLAKTPDLGRRTSFAAKELQGLRCITVEKPFQKHLLFYRHDATTVYAERAVHGARDLPIRLTQQSGLEGE